MPLTCQWIEGDPRERPAKCGAKTLPGCSWCSLHHGIVFQSMSPGENLTGFVNKVMAQANPEPRGANPILLKRTQPFNRAASHTDGPRLFRALQKMGGSAVEIQTIPHGT